MSHFRSEKRRTSVLKKLNFYLNGSTVGYQDTSNGGEHFLKTSAARSISVIDILNLTENDAFKIFSKLRWPDTNGTPYCPRCAHDRCYFITTRKRFKCAACSQQFSITSGTILHGAKLRLKEYLAIIILFINSAKGISALQISRDVGISYKSAFVLLHKFREAISIHREKIKLFGEIEIDGAYYGGYVRPANRGRQGKWRRKKVAKKCVLTLSQRGGPTIVKETKSENTEEILAVARKHIEPNSIVYADEASGYDALHALFEVYRINHGRSYSDGIACTNQAESFHARMKRAEKGQYHNISGVYFGRYACEQAFRTDRRRTDNGNFFFELLEYLMSTPVSREWKGYWRNRTLG